MEDPIKRAEVLLKAAHDLLKKCNDGPFVKNALEETVFYDEAVCDGFCLMEDIGHWIEFDLKQTLPEQP